MELLVFWFIMAIICGMVAASKNRSGFLYFFGGLLLWPIVLVAAILAKPRADGPSEDALKAVAWREAKSPSTPAVQDAFAADGMIGSNPYRKDASGVVVLVNGTPVRFASYEIARREIMAAD